MIDSMVKTVLKNITIMDILEAINKKYGASPALRTVKPDTFSKEISYLKLGRRVITVSSALIAFGVKKGDRVAILSENRPEWAIAFFGIISSAATTVPVDVKLSEKEIQFILNDSEAKCVFVSEKYLPIIDNLRDVLPHIERVIVFDATGRKDVIMLKKMILHKGEHRSRPIYPEDTALIVYTSGTTGVAKGVELTCRNLLFQVLAFSEILLVKKDDQFLSILPLNHMLEITGGLIAPLYAGGCVTYCDTLKTSALLLAMQKTRTQAIICVPLVLKIFYENIIKKIRKLPLPKRIAFNLLFGISKTLLKFNVSAGKIFFKDLHKEFGGNLKGFVSGGAPLDAHVEIGLNAMGLRVLQGYGLTETAPVISVNTMKKNRLSSVGRALPGVEIKILKAKRTDSEGEILTRGPHIMKGYYKNSEKTDEIIKNGWLHTGDLGYIDGRGFLHITGRLKNMIVMGGGKKVFPEEVESVLGKSPYIKEICVMAKPAMRGLRKGHEEVHAAIVPNTDLLNEKGIRDKQDIRNRIFSEINGLSKNLTAYKRLAGFSIFYEELPKTVTKKFKRKVISDMLNT